MGAGLVAFFVYAIGGIIWSRLYYARRHGLGIDVDVPAALVGVFWPVTVFVLWRPQLCQHRHHVLERAERRERWEAENQRFDRAMHDEGRR